MDKIFLLLTVYQLKHFLADYPLQFEFMLEKFHPRIRKWVPALATHCLVHGAFTLAIVIAVGSSAYWLAALDFIAHFVMDRVKASPKLLGRFKALSAREYFNLVHPKWHPDDMSHEGRTRHNEIKAQLLRSNKYFWWCLGIDQMVHHLTHYFIIWRIVTP